MFFKRQFLEIWFLEKVKILLKIAVRLAVL